MSIEEFQEALKNLSGDELARVQHVVLADPDLDGKARRGLLILIGHEVAIRQSEGLGRKADRFLKRHGERIGLVALGALVGMDLSN